MPLTGATGMALWTHNLHRLDLCRFAGIIATNTMMCKRESERRRSRRGRRLRMVLPTIYREQTMLTEIEVAWKHFPQPTRVDNVGLEPPRVSQRSRRQSVAPTAGANSASVAPSRKHSSTAPHQALKENTRPSATPSPMVHVYPGPIFVTEDEGRPVPGDHG